MKKSFKGFSLIETMAAIGVITLCIISLISVYYSIYKMQNYAMYDSLLKRKVETIFFTKINPKLDIYIKENPSYIYDTISKLSEDEDLKKLIEIQKIEFNANLSDSNITEVDLSKNFQYSIKHKHKRAGKFSITYRIIKTNKINKLEIFFPIIRQEEQPIPTMQPSNSIPGQQPTIPPQSARREF